MNLCRGKFMMISCRFHVHGMCNSYMYQQQLTAAATYIADLKLKLALPLVKLLQSCSYYRDVKKMTNFSAQQGQGHHVPRGFILGVLSSTNSSCKEMVRSSS